MKLLKIFGLSVLTLVYACSTADSEKRKEKANEEKHVEEIEGEIKLPGDFTEVALLSSDSIYVHANIYEFSKDAPVILLCHQARYNKTEYKDIAPKLMELGFNCIAIDQRSGGELNGLLNVTHENAVNKDLPVEFLDAEKDILSAIDFAYDKYGKKIILWGSSYSSTLALWIGLNSEKVKAVISFSPGDYFPEKGSLTDSLEKFNKPFWVTSSKEEEPELTKMLAKMKRTENQIQFIPKGNGEHGSKALWEEKPDHEEYWQAITVFFEKIK